MKSFKSIAAANLLYGLDKIFDASPDTNGKPAKRTKEEQVPIDVLALDMLIQVSLGADDDFKKIDQDVKDGNLEGVDAVHRKQAIWFALVDCLIALVGVRGAKEPIAATELRNALMNLARRVPDENSHGLLHRSLARVKPIDEEFERARVIVTVRNVSDNSVERAHVIAKSARHLKCSGKTVKNLVRNFESLALESVQLRALVEFAENRINAGEINPLGEI